ncbi:MAG: hypothetical protein PUD34_03980 [bacterium]|nr:hypothetical protein [bacterium]
MGFLDKLKNVLFEDEEDIVEEEQEEKEQLPQPSEDVRFKSNDKTKKEEQQEGIKREVPKPKESVFQSFDEEEFDRIAAINKNRLLERDRKAREEKELERRNEERRMHEEHKETMKVQESVLETARKKEEVRYQPSSSVNIPKESKYQQNIYNKPLPAKTETKKFTPSPVISPVYGILDKNYRKEDILPRASSEGTLPKMMDVDNVRKKAFGVLEQNLSSEEPLKKFKAEDEMSMEEMATTLGVTSEDELVKTSRIDLNELEQETSEDLASYKMDNDTAKSPSLPKQEDEDSLEKDLFNLIDSMYENKEEK